MKAFVPLITLVIGAAHAGFQHRPVSSNGNAPVASPNAGPRSDWAPISAAPRDVQTQTISKDGWMQTPIASTNGWAQAPTVSTNGWAQAPIASTNGWAHAPSAPRDGWEQAPAVPRDGWTQAILASPMGGWTPNASPQPSHASGPTVTPVHVSAPAATPRVHEIHANSGKQQIRIEEYSRPAQIIRVHEAPQGLPEIVKVHAPAEKAALIRVISKNAGPAHVERVVHRAPGPQIINVHKPAPAPARIVQVVRGPAPAPHVEFHYEDSPAHEVHVASTPAEEPLQAPVPVPAFVPAPQTIALPAPALADSGPVEVSSHIIPARAKTHGPHTVQTRYVEPSHTHTPPSTATVNAHPTDFRNLPHGSSHKAPRDPLLSPLKFGSAPSFNHAPVPHPKPIGTVYDAGDHIKIIKKSHY